MSPRPDLASDHPWRRGAMRQANFTPLWAVPPQALGLEYAGHFNWALRRGHRSRPLSFAPSTPHSLLAVGLLTMDSELAAEKRTLARSTFFSTFSALRGAAYEARYLLPRLPLLGDRRRSKPARRRGVRARRRPRRKGLLPNRRAPARGDDRGVRRRVPRVRRVPVHFLLARLPAPRVRMVPDVRPAPAVAHWVGGVPDLRERARAKGQRYARRAAAQGLCIV